MKIARTKEGFTISRLTDDQVAYLTALVAASQSIVDEDGIVSGRPVCPGARRLFVPLSEAAARFGLTTLVARAERSQEQWRRKTVDEEVTA